ncbi:protein kinase domain protein [Penicillium maclennaniae]|uniref:protein kinase domain protein n=1 Tax=Penicillium maclennaniae TaxID=1343394 RepID=UPI0025403F18|nr:protein kinase domain protein [Penicillium maclennaniae]KAJ5667820.1 protein kinase domain protein [Penicillium maclennaniae]
MLSPGPPLPPGILVDEEISPVYNSKYFYPVKPGEVLADRYQNLVKVGWGVSSTVWLARDLQGHIEEPESVVALKIINNNASSAGHEREVKEHISTADPSHRGRSLIRTLLDSFEFKGLEGSYLGLVYPPMRESLSMYQRRFDDRKMPLPLIKTYIRALLTGLDYLHKLVDFGLATRLQEDDDWGVWPIQPDHYRAPEVILGNGWQMPADIWNLGVLNSRNISGRFLYEDLIPNRKLGDTVLFLGGEEKEAFLDLAKRMLVWHPDKRKRQANWLSTLFFNRNKQAPDFCELLLKDERL